MEGKVTSEVIKLSDDYRKRRDREIQLDFEMTELIDPETHDEPGDEFESVFVPLEEEYFMPYYLTFLLDPFVRDIYLSVKMVFGVGCKCVSGIWWHKA